MFVGDDETKKHRGRPPEFDKTVETSKKREIGESKLKGDLVRLLRRPRSDKIFYMLGPHVFERNRLISQQPQDFSNQ
ncbi:hypothetical protein YC2023_092209 [Brassica napus]